MTLIYKKGRKEDSGNNRPVNLTLVLGKNMEQIILKTVRVQDNQRIMSSKQGFMQVEKASIGTISNVDTVFIIEVCRGPLDHHAEEDCE
ncbi:hypothetical protein BTVI_11101 [Pitangus sulphuratus]|nr:hypothetical protein BTVI_11101 [Pitangus sulphuratus]